MKVLFESPTCTISSSLSRKNTPRIDGVFFLAAKNSILGKTYELSLVYVGSTRIKNLNSTYRHKNYATDILSFTLDKNTGEIYIYPTKAKIKSKLFNRSYENYLQYLIVHGILHLKGYDHETDTDALLMEKQEKYWCKKLGI